MYEINTVEDIVSLVKERMTKQGFRCVIEQAGHNRCVYLRSDGARCAFGCLLPDEYLKEHFTSMEKQSAITVMENLPCPSNWNPHLWSDYDVQLFCTDIQNAHDHNINEKTFLKNFCEIVDELYTEFNKDSD